AAVRSGSPMHRHVSSANGRSLPHTSPLCVLQSSEEQAPVPQNKSMEDIEELAASYERKLIE
ncbi:hypothetical protein JOQ06_026881, partial [Pogonophryne albipinna]